MPQKISQFFEQDHREIDALLAGVDYARPKESFEPFHEFHMRLERHIHWEEGVLFPALGAKIPMLAQGPIRVMLMEHERIRASKASALQALKSGNGRLAEESAKAMLMVLADHNSKEERILYPACDDAFSAEEAEKIIAKVRALSPEPERAEGAEQA